VSQTIAYYFSLNSPWSYLGDARLAKIVARHGATVLHKPTNFGLVFPETGGLPLQKRAPVRQAYRLQELNRWPAHLGIPLIKQPDHFPSNERIGVGMVIAAINEGLDVTDLVNAIMTALWAEDRDIGDEATLIGIAEAQGLDGQGLLDKGREDTIDAQWLQYSRDAVAKGVFGAPTYTLGEQLFWGQDRLEFLDRALATST
jgi:2-hydroxychromene-2-carboxylate isomerase